MAEDRDKIVVTSQPVKVLMVYLKAQFEHSLEIWDGPITSLADYLG